MKWKTVKSVTYKLNPYLVSYDVLPGNGSQTGAVLLRKTMISLANSSLCKCFHCGVFSQLTAFYVSTVKSLLTTWLLCAAMSELFHIHTCWRINLQHKGPGQCRNGSHNEAKSRAQYASHSQNHSSEQKHVMLIVELTRHKGTSNALYLRSPVVNEERIKQE